MGYIKGYDDTAEQSSLLAIKIFDKFAVKQRANQKEMVLNEIECLRQVQGIEGIVQLKMVIQSTKQIGLITNFAGRTTLKTFMREN